MRVIKLSLACCLCRRPISPTHDVYALDAEWQRRYPHMAGVLACSRCALETSWSCEGRPGHYVDGHIEAAKPDARDIDAWSHIEAQGTQKSMALLYPESALLQGAGEYLRAVVTRGQTVQADRIRLALAAGRPAE